MIGRLRGEVVERSATTAIIDVGGVGYLVHVARRGGMMLGERVELFVHTHVREDAIHLFGFASSLDREVFELLISVPGVGPTKAVAMLETPPEELVSLVRAKDHVRLAKLPGIGKRTAERLVLDLHEKMAALSIASAATPSSRPAASSSRTREDLTSALVNLGFKPAIAESTAAKALERLPDAPLDALLKDALAALTSRG